MKNGPRVSIFNFSIFILLTFLSNSALSATFTLESLYSESYASLHLNYDDNGVLARKGSINNDMLEGLNQLSYYSLPFPKSTGYEWFIDKVVPVIDATKDTTENLLCTAVHHICEQVALQIKTNVTKDQSTLFVTGGGALNQFMMELLQSKLAPTVSLVIPSKKLIEYKEALIFALMGILRIEQEINVLKTVTGASKDSSSGVVYLPT